MNSVAAEKTLVSTLLYDISRMESIQGRITKDDFFDDVCRQIFVLTEEHYFTKKPFNELAAVSLLPSISDEIVEIASAQPVGKETLVMLSDRIADSSRKRAQLAALEEAKQDLIAGRDPQLDKLTKIGSKRIHTHRSNEEIIERMEARIQNPVMDHGTGLSDLDRYLSLEPGNLIVIAARPSMGKTALVITIILHLLKKKEGSIFFSLEMPAEAIMMRAISNASREELSNIRRNRIVDRDGYMLAKDSLSGAKNFLLIDDALDEIQIYNIAISQIRANPSIKNVFIDHLTYISDSGGHQNTHLRIGAITKTMKRLAKEAGVKVWLLSQLSRSIESRANRRPQLSDMRESGSIEEDADVILGLYRESYYKVREEGGEEAPSNPVEISILKNRDGEVGTAHALFVGPIVKFLDKSAVPDNVTVVEYSDEPSVSMPVI
jgi:replicative DNA helicase